MNPDDETTTDFTSPTIDGVDIGLTFDGLVRVRFNLGEKRLIMLWKPDMAEMYAALIKSAASHAQEIRENLEKGDN